MLERGEGVPIVTCGAVREDRAGLEHLHRETEVMLHRRDRRVEPLRDPVGERMGSLEPGNGEDARGEPGSQQERERQRRGVARDGSGLQRQQQPHVGDRRRERSERREVDPIGDGVAADHAVRRLEARQSAERRGDPDRTPAVGGGRDRRHPRCERSPGPPARPAGRPVRPPWVRGRAVQRIGRESRERELRLVRLARPRSRRPRAACAAPARRPRRAPRPRTSTTRTWRACPSRPPCPSPAGAVRRADPGPRPRRSAHPSLGRRPTPVRARGSRR